MSGPTAGKGPGNHTLHGGDAAGAAQFLTQIRRERDRFDRYDPDPYLFMRLRQVAIGECEAPCEGGYFPCDKCDRGELEWPP